MAKGNYFLRKGNGHQAQNKKRALEYAKAHIPGIEAIDETTIRFRDFGLCHFSAYTDAHGAMISTPKAKDDVFGSRPWHYRDNFFMFRDFGDGRGIVYVCPIKPLFDLQTIGHHGVTWADVLKTAVFKEVFRFEAK